MNNYRVHQIIASVSVTIFILCTALCILVQNRSIYEKTNKEYRKLMEQTETALKEDDFTVTQFESEVNYNQIADEFSTFFGNDYKLIGYEISHTNVERLKELKSYYRWAWVFAMSSFIVGIRSFIVLSKRRLYMPLVYGGMGAAFMTTVFTVIMACSKNGLGGHIRRMVFERDYSFFSGQDALVKFLPPEFANRLFIAYIVIVLLLILAMLVIRGIIIYCGRPHRF